MIKKYYLNRCFPKETYIWLLVHEKMIHIINHQGNAKQNHMGFYFTPVRTAVIKKTRNNKYSSIQEIQEITRNSSIGENVQKREPFCTVGGNENSCSQHGKYYGGSLKY